MDKFYVSLFQIGLVIDVHCILKFLGSSSTIVSHKGLPYLLKTVELLWCNYLTWFYPFNLSRKVHFFYLIFRLKHDSLRGIKSIKGGRTLSGCIWSSILWPQVQILIKTTPTHTLCFPLLGEVYIIGLYLFVSWLCKVACVVWTINIADQNIFLNASQVCKYFCAVNYPKDQFHLFLVACVMSVNNKTEQV